MPAMITLSFEKEPRAYEGYSPAECARRLFDAGADIVGINCLRSPELTLPIMRRDARRGVGSPRLPAGRLPHSGRAAPTSRRCPRSRTALEPLQLTRAEMADYAVRARDLGVRYIGSCCGSVACHVRAMAKALGKLPVDEREWRSRTRQGDVGVRVLRPRPRSRGRRRRPWERCLRGSRRTGTPSSSVSAASASGALYWLARELRGDVLGLEQFELGHERGASQDVSRIIRYSYHRPHYVRLARRAYEAWRTVEEESRESLVVPVGGLDLFPERGTIPARRLHLEPRRGVRSRTSSSMRPRSVAAGRRSILEPIRCVVSTRPTAVWSRAAKANAAHASLAREYGAQVRERREVSGLRSKGGEIDLVVDGVRYRCAKLVIACGAWSNELLRHFGVQLPLTVTQEQVVYWQPADPALLRENRFPIWIWMDDPSFYGFPYLEEAGFKVGQDVGGREVTARTRTFDPDAEALERVRGFLERTIPSAPGEVRSVKTCLYTLTPDRDFVVDGVRAEGAEGCYVAIGAGHAFKFASVIGKALAGLALRGAAPEGVDLEPFRIDRDVLREENPKRSFLV